MKRNIKTMSFAAVAAFAMVSCSSHDSWTSYEDLKKAEYDAAFVKKYGNIDPNHDWGFGNATTTRASNSSYTKWQSDRNWDNMPENPVSQNEIDYVLQYIADHPDEGGTECDLTNYYMQNIGSSKDSYHLNFIDGNGNVHHSTDIVGGNQMDYLVIDGYHINDYNATTGSFGLAENLPLQDITYHDSYANLTIENAYKFYYIEYNGKVNLYLCFDYRTSKYDNGQLTFDGDGVYNDWVVKLSPADGRTLEKPTGEITYAKRIFCEDLGAIGDFDFNDVVFDALIKDGKTYIKLLAAGGTMNLTVAGHEVHREFDEDVTTMINTGAGPDKTYVEFFVEDDFDNDYSKIPVVVTNAADMYNTSYELKNTIGHAPQKLCVPVNTGWTIEFKGIELAYPAFKNWVVNANNDNVFENADEEYIYAR